MLKCIITVLLCCLTTLQVLIPAYNVTLRHLAVLLFFFATAKHYLCNDVELTITYLLLITYCRTPNYSVVLENVNFFNQPQLGRYLSALLFLCSRCFAQLQGTGADVGQERVVAMGFQPINGLIFSLVKKG